MQINIIPMGTYAAARVLEDPSLLDDLEQLAAWDWAEQEGLCDEPSPPSGLPESLRLQAELQQWGFRLRNPEHRIVPLFQWAEDPSHRHWASRVPSYAEPGELYNHVVRMARTQGRSSAAQFALRLVYAEWKDGLSDHWTEIEEAVDCTGLTLAQYLGFEPD